MARHIKMSATNNGTPLNRYPEGELTVALVSCFFELTGSDCALAKMLRWKATSERRVSNRDGVLDRTLLRLPRSIYVLCRV